MVAGNRPVAELDIDASLVRQLLVDQHPDLAPLALQLLTSGWDNVLFRLGSELVVRLPRRQLAAPLVENELRWLPALAPDLTLPVPLPVAAGAPGRGYPWSWMVSPWLAGETAASTPPDDLCVAADTLARFLDSLHRPAPTEAPPNPFRGVPLADRHEAMVENLRRLGSSVDARTIEERWEAVLAVRPWCEPPVWIHGDLHPSNLLVHEGRLSGVIDFGDLTAGDPATDLSVAWMLFPPAARERFRAASGVDDDTWARARGWALTLSVAYLANSADDPITRASGSTTLAAVLADDG